MREISLSLFSDKETDTQKKQPFPRLKLQSNLLAPWSGKPIQDWECVSSPVLDQKPLRVRGSQI